MEPIISKLQEGVKYPRFERDATTIINDLVEHITKERGVYSSSIEPNPSEHKVWFNTNNNTLNIYENGKWNTISGQGGGSGSGSIPSHLTGIYNIDMVSGTISGVQTLNISPGGSIGMQGASINGGNIAGATITGATISGGILTGNISASGATINNVTISGAAIKWSSLTGSISASGADIRGATISDGVISGGTITGSVAASGATINGATINNATIQYSTLTGSTELIGDVNASGATIRHATISGGTISGATISGGNIDVNKIKASDIEVPYIRLTSGNTIKLIQLLGDNYVFSGKLADSAFLHSIDLNSGSIAGLTSIKTLSYTGLTIEPYDEIGTGTPITIHGKAAGLSLGANSTAPFTLNGVSSLNWKQGTSNGYMMVFNTNNNTINSNYDTFNITNGSVTLTSGMISGNTKVNLSLYGTISGVTIRDCYLTGSISASGATLHGATISAGSISNGTISYGTLSGSIAASGASIRGVTIDGGTIRGGKINGATLESINISSGSINEGGQLNYGNRILVTYTGSISNPILIPNGGNIGNEDVSLTLCSVTLTGGNFTK